MSREYSVLRSKSEDGSEFKTCLVENPIEGEPSDYFVPKFIKNANLIGVVQIMGDVDELDSNYESC